VAVQLLVSELPHRFARNRPHRVPEAGIEAKPMAYLRKFLRLPANESSVGLVLSLSVVILGLMSIALVWQAEIIANRREVIRWLEGMKIGA
jgi:hypothetical protein